MTRIKREHIAAIYAAATEPDTLRCISDVLMEVFDANSSGMWLINKGVITDLTGTADVQESAKDYLSYYQRLDVWGGANPSYIDKVMLGHEKIDDAALLKTEFYNDFARHYGIRDPMGMVMTLGPGLYASVGLNRIAGRRLFTDEDKPLLQEMAFHIEAALKLSHCFEAKVAQAARSHPVFDSLLLGIVICGKDGIVHYANSAAERLAEQGSGFSLRSKTLTATAASESKALQQTMWRAAHGQGTGCRLSGRNGTMVSVVATPLIEDKGTKASGKALLALRRDDATPCMTTTVLRDLYGFTPAQAELALLLLSGMTFEEAARARDIALTTARTHFNAILAKSNARNLRDFLRMLGSLPQIGQTAGGTIVAPD